MRTPFDSRNIITLTARCLVFERLADGTYSAKGWNFGDVVMHKLTTTQETRKKKMHPTTGVAITVDEQIKSTEAKYEFTLQEHTLENELMRFFGADAGNVVQAAAAGTVVTVNAVAKRGIYELGKFGLSAVTATVAAAAKKVGVRDLEGTITPADADLVLDAANGTIEILEAGTIADGANVAVTFTCQALYSRKITAMAKPRKEARFVLTEYDGQTGLWRQQCSGTT